MDRTWKHMAAACALICAVWAGPCRAEDQPPPKPAAEVAPPKPRDEPELRRTFMHAFTAANQPEAKAETVLMLKGVHEKASLKILTGLLGDSLPTVRRNACRVMSETPDPDGYFVKPLTAALYDRNFMVRTSAAEALAMAKVKEPAVKALVFALTQCAQDGVKLASYAQTLNATLSQLTGKQFGKTDDLKKLAEEWNAYYQTNEHVLTQADEKYLKSLEAPDAAKSNASEPEGRIPVPKTDEPKTGERKDQ